MRLTEVEIVRESVKKVVGILSNRKIPVTQIGGKAFVEYNPKTHEPVRVNLPYLPDNATPQLLTSIQGFLDHEVGHLLFSTQDSLAKSVKLGLGSVYGVLEDTFVERKMRQAFKGSQKNLGNTITFIQEKLIKPRLEEALASGSADKIQAELLVSALRAYAGEKESQEFMKPYWDYMKPFEKMVGQDVIDKIKTISSSEEALKIAVSIQNRIQAYRERLEQEEKEKEEKAKSKGKDQKQDKSQKQENSGDDETKSDPSEDEDSEGSGESGDSEEKSDKKTKGKSSPEGKDGDPSESPSDKSDKGEDEDEDEDEEEKEKPDSSENGDDKPDKGEGSDEDSDGESDEDGDEDSDGESDEDGEGSDEEKKGMETEFVNPDFIEAAMKGMKDMDSVLSDVISTEVRNSISKHDYVPLTADNDIIEPYTPKPMGDDESLLSDMEDRCSQMTGILQKRFERTLAAKSAARLVPGFTSGRIHAASLFRAKLGDERVFRKKIVSTTKDVAVTLLIDMSGSMAGRKVQLALASGMAMSLPLDRMNIKHEVLGFTTSREYRKISERNVLEQWNEFHRMNGRFASRMEPIYMPVFKAFDQRLTPDRKRALAVAGRRVQLMNNTDGESLIYAAKRLQARKETRKVMIVLSDGCPCQGPGSMAESSRHLADTVKKLSGAGIEMFGIGIMSEYVEYYYPNSVVINDISDLPVTVMNTMESMLLGTGKK